MPAEKRSPKTPKRSKVGDDNPRPIKSFGRASDILVRAIINSLVSNIAVIDQQGNIIYVNEAWEDFARKNGDEQMQCTCCGTNYLSVCSNAAFFDENARKVALQGYRWPGNVRELDDVSDSS
jgi:transcriptional regulator with PAS, ATPase and Fis domain